MKKKFYPVLSLTLLFVLIGCSHNAKSNNASSDQNAAENNVSEESSQLLMAQPGGATRYEVNTQESKLAWAGESVIKVRHFGTVDISEGVIFELNGTPNSGEFVMDMNTITSDNDSVTKHLKSDDFFAVEIYPTSRLLIKSIVGETDESTVGNYTITADLTIKEITNEIIFPAQISKQGTTYTGHAEFAIDRTLWGVTFGSDNFFYDLKDKAIADEISFTLDITASAE